MRPPIILTGILFSALTLLSTVYSQEVTSNSSVTITDGTPTSIDECLKSVVTIESDEGKGSGFIVKEGNSFYVYTNTHVATLDSLSIYDSNYKRISDLIKVECARGEGVDLARITLRHPRKHYFHFAPSPSTLKSDVIALGNSHGQGVSVMLEGTIKGIGAREIEVTCDIVPGNSGGPVVDLSTFDVVGVSTRILRSDHWTSADTSQESRRLATRCDNEVSMNWSMTSLSKLNSAAAAIQHTYETTNVLAAVLEFHPTSNGFSYRSEKAQEARSKYSEHPIINSAQNLSSMLADASSRGKNWSDGDLTKNYLKFYHYAMNYASSDFKKAKRLAISGYHSKELKELSKFQNEVASIYKKKITTFKENPRKIWISN